MSAATTKTPRQTMKYRSGWSAALTFQPNTLIFPIVVTEPKLPVKYVLEKIICWTANPIPSVTTARLMPRVRNAGIAKTKPLMVANATPARNASSAGQCSSATRRAANSAPKPPTAYCASDSCPAYPVSATIERMKIPTISDVNSAVDHLSSNARLFRSASAPTTVIRNQRVTTPVPRSGSFSSTWLRSGSALPRTTSTTTITRNGSARWRPVAPSSIPSVS